MKVKDLIKKLEEYNPNADVSVVVDLSMYDFVLAYGTSEGCRKETCENVSFYVEELNKEDK